MISREVTELTRAVPFVSLIRDRARKSSSAPTSKLYVFETFMVILRDVSDLTRMYVSNVLYDDINHKDMLRKRGRWGKTSSHRSTANVQNEGANVFTKCLLLVSCLSIYTISIGIFCPLPPIVKFIANNHQSFYCPIIYTYTIIFCIDT